MRILYAEDSKSVARHIITFLENGGHVVTHVENGLAAVNAFAAEFPDLVLLDIVMPVMDGIEATRKIKTLAGRRWIPVMLMTSLAAHDEVVAGMHAGADDYLIKPIVLEILQARIQSMERIAAMQDSLFGILDNVYEAVLTINKQGVIQSYNRAAENIFGYPAKEVMGKNVSMLMPQPYADEHDGYLARYQQEGTPRVIGIGRKVRGLRKNGEVFPMRLAVTEVRRGTEPTFIGLVSDISSEEAARERIEFLAMHDTLTGLPNRTQFNAHLENLCLQSDNDSHAVLFIDLDGFKPINDRLGHHAGDDALKIAAQRLRHSLATDDFVARLGGDEFVVICHNTSNPADALAIGERLLTAIGQPMTILGSDCSMGASIGIALFPQDGHTPSDILSAADHAMYLAKKRGKHQVVLAEDPLSKPPIHNPNKFTMPSLDAIRYALDQHAIVSITDANGEILEVNDKFCEISGYSRETLLGQNHRLLKSGHHSKLFFEEMWETICAGLTWHGEVCNRRADGSEYWVRSSITPILDADGLPKKYISIRTDITDIKNAEQAIREREIRYHSLVKSVSVGIVLHNREGQIVECNPAAAAILGLPMESILGRLHADNAWHYIHADGRQLSDQDYPAVQTITQGCSLRDVLIGVYRKDGRLVWISAASEPIRDPDDPANITGAVVSFVDVTERRYIETRFAFAVEGAGDGVWDWNIPTGDMPHSGNYEGMLGYNRGEIQLRIPMKGATDSNPKPATFSGRKPTTHPHGYRQGQMYAHIVAAWVGASG